MSLFSFTPISQPTMKPTRLFLALFLALAVSGPISAEPADPVRGAAKQLVEARADASLVLTVTRKMQRGDKTFEIHAIPVNGEGLLVTSLKAIENNRLAGVAGLAAMMNQAGQAQDSGELTRVAWIRPDATEAEGELVLKDENLDLAFVRIRKDGDAALPPAPAAVGKAPGLLQEVISIHRLSAEFQREAALSMGRVSSLIQTPAELFQVPELNTVGSACYSLSGEWLGMVALVQGQQVIVPAATIVGRAENAPAEAQP